MSQTPGVRLILDQGVPRDTATLLREAGHHCTHVAEIGMSAAADSEILAIAAQSGSIVVTLDADFHTILAVSGMSAPSAIRLRLQPVDAIGVAAIVQEILTSFDAQLKGGCLITAKAHKITCHGLPIGGKAE